MQVCTTRCDIHTHFELISSLRILVRTYASIRLQSLLSQSSLLQVRSSEFSSLSKDGILFEGLDLDAATNQSATRCEVDRSLRLKLASTLSSFAGVTDRSLPLT
jgi:hypothetical protein